MKTVVSDGECLVKLFDALQQQQRGKDQQQEQQQQREGQHEDQHEEQQHDIVLECVITLDKVSDEQKEKAEALKIRLLSWEDLLELGRANMVPLSDELQPTLESLHTICYTSGK
ncbi:hypothetical protein, conserved [Eimeria praecox]|uniref:Uncharacterized protein n=1 Tax=Eimeria praecox TaxID=51316 RepID=U6HBC8_9EIME|nr:hypothetical protein, conserved [Eimeria praecox]